MHNSVCIHHKGIFFSVEYATELLGVVSLLCKAIPSALFNRFLNLLNRFEADSNFSAFYDSHRHYYEKALQHFVENYDLYNPLAFLTNYLGTVQENTFHINLMLGITNSNYGVSIGNHLYANLRPNPKTRFAPLPDYSYSPIYWTTLIVHEFAHSFVNPISAKYRSQIGCIDIAPYQTVLKEMMYGESMETYINETIIRAIECFYVLQHFQSYYEEYISDYENEGFCKIRQTEQFILNGMQSLESNFLDILSLF